MHFQISPNLIEMLILKNKIFYNIGLIILPILHLILKAKNLDSFVA